MITVFTIDLMFHRKHSQSVVTLAFVPKDSLVWTAVGQETPVTRDCAEEVAAKILKTASVASAL